MALPRAHSHPRDTDSSHSDLSVSSGSPRASSVPGGPVAIPTCVTRGCSSAAEPLPTQRTAKRRQRQHRSTIRLSALCLFRVSDSTGQIWARTGRGKGHT